MKYFLSALVSGLAMEAFDFEALLTEAQRDRDFLVSFRRDLHQHPEIGLNTYRTRDRVVDELTKLGITPSVGWAKGPSCERAEGAGVVFDLGTGTQPAVLLRADMDALPIHEDSGVPFASLVDGRMHACGHDTHTTMLLGAVKLLKAREAELRGTVRIMFQPGEEGWFGGKYMVEEGVLTKTPAIQHAVALHVVPRAPTGHLGTGLGPSMAGGGKFNITVHGVGGHAGVPSATVDPIVTAASIIQELQHLVSRESIGGGAKAPYLLSVTQIHGGFTHNVIPSTVTFSGSARAMTNDRIQRLQTRIREVAEAIAKAHRATVDVEFDQIVPPLIIDGTVKEYLSKLQMKASTIPQGLPAGEFVYGMEDFAFVANEVPSAMYGIGVGGPGSPELHSPKFVVDENVLPRGAAFLAASAAELIETLIAKSKDEL